MSSIPVRDPVEFSDTLFDFLIVGGGTAGLVIATRLSEDPSCKVGVLEAGSSALDEPTVTVPGRGGQTIGTKYDWAYETTGQEGLNSRKVPWPRGKMLGGSSGMNLMIWNRACREDYDAWEELGNPGWGWDSLSHYFKKTETLHPPSVAHTQEFSSFVHEQDHGTSGPVHTSYPPFAAETHRHWHATLEKLGISANRAHFGGSTVGAWTALAAVDPVTQTRSYSATAYLLPNARRKNLFVLTEAQVTEVLLQKADNSHHRATGVRFDCQGHSFIARCSREVVLSAGSIGSPHLLELSGIGSPEVLQKAGVPVKVANPNVGENLQDHMMTMTVYELQPWIKTPDDYADAKFAQEADLLYSTSRKGMRTCLPASFAYLPVQKIISQKESANYENKACEYTKAQPSLSRDHKLNLIRQRQFSAASNIGQIEYVLDHSSYSPFYPTQSGKKYATLMQMLQYPYSRGSVHISPQQPKTLVIDPKYYLGEGAIDLDMMFHAQNFGDRIWRTKPMSSIIVKRVWPPEAAAHENMDWRKWIRENTITDWHPCGTCSMLPRESGGVVDHQLKVYGTTNLRIADASVFPLHIGGHPQATIYAIGEKVADMIKEEAGSRVNGHS